MPCVCDANLQRLRALRVLHRLPAQHTLHLVVSSLAVQVVCPRKPFLIRFRQLLLFFLFANRRGWDFYAFFGPALSRRQHFLVLGEKLPGHV